MTSQIPVGAITTELQSETLLVSYAIYACGAITGDQL